MIIEAQHVSVKIRDRFVLNGETVCCKSGRMTALVGPSGSGKTTLLHCLGLLLPIDQGRILLDERDMTNYSMKMRRKFWQEHAAFILQDYGIMDEESVAFNVTMQSSVIRKHIAGNQELLAQTLEQTGLKGREQELAGHLSGGEKQRLALARAIYKDADLLFVDEPTASLDQANRQLVIRLLQAFAKRGRTVIVSTHDAEMIEACDEIHHINQEKHEVNIDENNC